MIIKIPDKIRKILLPFFPENKALEKHGWYNLIKLVTVIITASSIYSVLWLIALFYFIPRSWMDSQLYPPIYHLSYLVAYLPINFTSLLSRFPIYQNVFHTLLPVPVIGPLALIFILISVFYLAPSLLYRLGIYISQNFYLKKVKIIFLAVLLVLGFFIFSTWKYQQLINEGSAIADEQCLKVNPLIIARKNSYVNSIKILEASGSADEYWTETNKYLDISKKYIEAENSWLATQKAYLNSKDTSIYVPAYITKACQLQYDSRVADVKATSAVVEFFETYKNIDATKQKILSDTIMNETKKSNDANDEYNKMYDHPQRTFDLRDYFTSVPESKCPPENLNIPNVPSLLAPPSLPVNPNGFNS